MTVREMLARVGSDELTEWQAYYRIEPWGGERGDVQAGIVATTIVNGLRGLSGSRGGKDVGPGDFLLRFGAPDVTPASADDLAAKLRAFTLARGGTVS